MTSDAAGKDILPSNTESASFVDSAGATVNKAGSSIPFSSITAGGAPEPIVIGDDGEMPHCVIACTPIYYMNIYVTGRVGACVCLC